MYSSLAPSVVAMLFAMSIATPDHSPLLRSLRKNGISPGSAAMRSTLVRRTRSNVVSPEAVGACAAAEAVAAEPIATAPSAAPSRRLVCTSASIGVTAWLETGVEPFDEAYNVVHWHTKRLLDLRRVRRQIGALADDRADIGVLAQQLLRHAQYFAFLCCTVHHRLAGAVVVAEDAVGRHADHRQVGQAADRAEMIG